MPEQVAWRLGVLEFPITSSLIVKLSFSGIRYATTQGLSYALEMDYQSGDMPVIRGAGK